MDRSHHLHTRLVELKASADKPHTLNHVHRLAKKLKEFDTEFKQHHYTLVKLVKSNEELAKEQTTLGEHEVADIGIKIEVLITSCSSVAESSINEERKSTISLKLANLASRVESTAKAVRVQSIEQYGEQLSDCRKELLEIRNDLLFTKIDDRDELFKRQSELEDAISDCLLKYVRCCKRRLMKRKHWEKGTE